MVERGSPFIQVVGGSRLDLPRGLALVGRGEEADLRLPSPEVSAQHAWLRRDGRTTWVNDANSTNGTWLNGTRLVAGRDQELHHGDRLEFGPVAAVFRDPAGGARRPPTRVQQRPGVSYGTVSAGTFNHAGRDVNNSYDQRQHHRYEFTTPEGLAITELATGRGAGRVLMVLGQLAALAGFCLWAFVIFRFITSISTSVSTPAAEFTPPELLGPPVLGGVPLGVVGFGLFVLGAVVSAVGLVVSKSARERRKR
ncbi:FHA domain-containing protein [Lentzea sp. CC55]|uniref:FHA domain-containing protein n=1 Tax=Lentzea sp. CC55 TaxID=2884909 RepID=UPI001F382651|nr:FHA domain-containing protein [Lentzea sp. CC55]MCG8926092.1 FHA domain-containing protein [Lentzea sp. CC55]